MLITTIKAKNKHPFLRQIPDDLWNDVFKKFDDSNLPMNGKPFSEITRSDLPESNQQACILLMLRYPETPVSELHDFILNTLKIKNEKLFSYSCYLGHVEMLKQLQLNVEPDKLQAMIIAERYSSFRQASAIGHLDTLNWLKQAAPNNSQEMIAAYNYDAFALASINGHIDVLNWLKREAPDKLQKMIAATDYYAIKGAIANGHIDILNWLKQETPNNFQEMIATHDYYAAFGQASANGHIDILQWLKQEAPDKFQEMITADNYSAFRRASENGHIGILQLFKQQAPDKLKEMIAVSDYYAFVSASANGHIDTLNWLKQEAPDNLQAMIVTKDYSAFKRASANGHLDTLKWLKQEAPDKLQEMIAAKNYFAFKQASQNGHLDTLKWLKQEAPDKLKEMIAVSDYSAFKRASASGHIDILKWLKQEAPDKLQAMIIADEYYAFKWASENGHIPILEWLKQEAPNNFQDMIAANDFHAFRRVSGATAKWLLEKGGVSLFAHAESHHQERSYQTVVYSFINDKLVALNQERETTSTINPNTIFNIHDAERAQQCFYIMRNLIRHNDPTLNQELRFLLDIPSVKALAHQADDTGENALLRLAMSSGNIDAATILLNIRNVRTLAEQNNFYRNEMEGGIDLTRLANNRESSMTALTPGEANRLKTAIDRYEPMLKQVGISNVMDDLRYELIERYQANPATILVNNQPLILPIEYKDLQQLQLSDENFQKALIAYYQNDAHTALRYLSKPNAWMHDEASYVNVHVKYLDKDGLESESETPDTVKRIIERWSTFEDYQDLISMLYTAAIDKQSEPINGYSFDSRLELFIKELALIGRAHNWDKTRVRDGKEEAYEDLEADRPSCFSGVKRRLFQSVQGHSLFSFLTQDVVHKELLKHIQEHFKETFKEEHRPDLNTVLVCVRDYEDIPEDVFKRLTSLNIPPEKIDQMIETMTKDFSEKYGAESFLPYIIFVKEQFILPEDNLNEDKRMTHLMQFYTSADLERILKASESKPTVTGLFSSRKRGADALEEKEESKSARVKISKSDG